MKLQRWIEPRSSDDHVARQEELVNILALGGVAAGLSYFSVLLVVMLLDLPGQAVSLPSFVGALGCIVLSYAAYRICRAGRVQLGAGLVIFVAAVVGLYAVSVRGSFSVDVVVMTPAVVFAGVALGRRAAYLTLFAELVIYAGMAVAEAEGWIHPLMRESSPITAIGITLVTMVILAMITGQTMTAMESFLRRMGERGQDLAAMAEEKDRLLAELRGREESQRRLLETVKELGTPVIPLAQGILAMPLIGAIDSRRAEGITTALLEGVARHRAHAVIIDVTGVPLVDTAVAGAILRAAQGVRLLGAEPILTGLRAEVAQTIIGLGLDLRGITTRAGLQEGLEYLQERLASDQSRL